MKTNDSKPPRPRRYGVMHGAFFLAIIMLHSMPSVYHAHGAGQTQSHSGISLVVIHTFAFIAIAVHAWKMSKRKKARAASAC